MLSILMTMKVTEINGKPLTKCGSFKAKLIAYETRSCDILFFKFTQKLTRNAFERKRN